MRTFMDKPFRLLSKKEWQKVEKWWRKLVNDALESLKI